MDNKCRHCGKTEEDTPLAKCRVCHQYFCDDHGSVRGGVTFCSPGCGSTFFNPDPDDDED